MIALHQLSVDQQVERLKEITIPSPDNFLKIKETLTRIGILNKRTNTLYQSCHILSKRGKLYIVHYKELFGLDGRVVDLPQQDIDRRDHIITLLVKWGLCSTVQPLQGPSGVLVTVIPHKDKLSYTLVPKYTLGK